MTTANQKEHYELNVIARGAITDREAGKTYLIETAVVSLNYVAYEVWVRSYPVAEYDAGCDLDEAEWETEEANKAARREEVRKWIASEVGFDPECTTVTHSKSEFFTAVYIHEIR